MIVKAGEAIKNEFYLEGTWIISKLMEEKLKNLLTRFEKHNPGLSFGIDQCLKRMKYLIQQDSTSTLAKHIEMRLIDDIRRWKNQRNILFKDVLHLHVSKKRLKKTSEDGILLLQELLECAKKFKNEWKKGAMKPDLTISTQHDSD
ncbi:MAG: hypothetical protein WCL00_09710 [Bacteroidota bacterium]